MFRQILMMASFAVFSQTLPLENHGLSYATSYTSSHLGGLGGGIAHQDLQGIQGPGIAYTAAPAAIGYAAPVVTKYAAPTLVQRIAAPTLVQKIATPTIVQKYVAPVIAKAPIIEENYGPAQYEFQYEVADQHTGDIKSHHEIRDGDVVKGQYSLHEPDGTVRTVEYSADAHSGFNAIVTRSGHASHPQVVAQKAIVAAAPVYYKH